MHQSDLWIVIPAFNEGAVIGESVCQARTLKALLTQLSRRIAIDEAQVSEGTEQRSS
jgi:hypothetical protein